MTHDDSYLAEYQSHERRRRAIGAVAAVMLAATGLAVLLVFDGAAPTEADLAAQRTHAASQPSLDAERSAAFR